jgi:gliding motility-associated-like protein
MKGALVQWSNGSRAPFIHITDTGVYRLEILIPPCIFSDSIRVSVRSCDTLPRDTLLPACTVYLPNAFSPNGDGVNDRFQPLLEAGCPVQSYQLNIYNRYGVRVFAGNDPARGWDGIFRGEPAPVGTYFYEMRWTGRDGRSFFRKGDVTLVR